MRSATVPTAPGTESFVGGSAFRFGHGSVGVSGRVSEPIPGSRWRRARGVWPPETDLPSPQTRTRSGRVHYSIVYKCMHSQCNLGVSRWSGRPLNHMHDLGDRTRLLVAARSLRGQSRGATVGRPLVAPLAMPGLRGAVREGTTLLDARERAVRK